MAWLPAGSVWQGRKRLLPSVGRALTAKRKKRITTQNRRSSVSLLTLRSRFTPRRNPTATSSCPSSTPNLIAWRSHSALPQPASWPPPCASRFPSHPPPSSTCQTHSPAHTSWWRSPSAGCHYEHDGVGGEGGCGRGGWVAERVTLCAANVAAEPLLLGPPAPAPATAAAAVIPAAPRGRNGATRASASPPLAQSPAWPPVRLVGGQPKRTVMRWPWGHA